MVSTVFLAGQMVIMGLLAVAVLAVLAEVGLRLLKPELDYFFVLDPYERKTHHLEQGIMPGLPLVSRYRTNSLGLRGREFARDDSYRVLAIGCSVTISVYVDQDQTWAALLERGLAERVGGRVWAGCVGRSEVTTRDLLTMIRCFVPQYRTALDALVFLVGVNDLALMLSKGAAYDPDFLNRASQARRFRRAFSQVPNRYSQVALWRKLALWKATSRIKRRSTEQIYYHEGAYYVRQRVARQRAGRMLTNLPDLTPGLDEFERNLNAIADLVQDCGLQPVFMTQPSLWRPHLSAEEQDLLWFGWVAGTSDYYSVEVLTRGMALYNERLLKVCRTRGLGCIDLASVIPKDTNVLYDDVHLNEGGSRRVAEALANYFLTTGAP